MIAEILDKGITNRKTSAELCQYFGFKTTRELQEAVMAERRAGVPILSSCGVCSGYYMPGSKKELKDFIRSMDGRREEIDKSTAAARKALENWTD